MATTTQQGASGPPPKPWETTGSSSSSPAPFRPPSNGSTSDVVEASGTAKPGEIVSTSNQSINTVNTNSVGRPLPSRPWENNYGSSSIGGYGSSLGYNSGYGSGGVGSGMYNSYGGGYGGVGGMYGNSTYGNSTYGSSMYRGGYGGGGLYGSGMYGGGMGGLGGPMGGYGMNGPLGPQDPNNPPPSPPGFWISFLRVMEGVVNIFGRISFLVDQNTQAVHLFMTALLQVFDRGGMLYGELARFVLKILGVRRRARKLPPTGPNGLPLPGSETQMDQRLIEGPKAAPAGAWDNVWGNDARR